MGDEELGDFMTAGEASLLARVCSATIHKWCVKYRLGHKVGGRWRVDRNNLDRFLRGDAEDIHDGSSCFQR